MRERRGTGELGTQGGRGAGQECDLLLEEVTACVRRWCPWAGWRPYNGERGKRQYWFRTRVFYLFIYFLSFFFFFGCSLWLANLSSLTRDGTPVSPVSAQNPKHWTAGKLARTRILNRKMKRMGGSLPFRFRGRSEPPLLRSQAASV